MMAIKLSTDRFSNARWQARFSAYFSLACVLFFVISSAFTVLHQSSYWDDPYHVAAGVAQLQTGDPRLNADHPPLARLLGALPSLFMDLPSVADSAPNAWKQADIFYTTNAYIGTIEERLLLPGRLTMLGFALLLGWLLYAWAKELFGAERAWLPLALFAFCPPLLANAPLVTTDTAATTLMFAAVYGWWRYLNKPTLVRLGWASLAVAAAFCAKFTAVLLAPLFLLSGIAAVLSPARLPYDGKRRMLIVGGALLAISAATIFGIDLAYFFDGVWLTPPEYLAHSRSLNSTLQAGSETLADFWPAWLPVPLPFYYVTGLIWVLTRAGSLGHWTYFLGEAGPGGWPNYFSLLLLVKLPIAALMLIGFGLSQALSRFSRDAWNVLFLALPPLLLIVIASIGKMQIGIRHILPAFPFLFLLAGYTLRYRLTRGRVLAAGFLVALSAVSTLSVYPNYLMYFNFLAGGPEQGWRISINGDDYGQGGSDLLRWLQARNIDRLAYLPNGWGGTQLSRAGISYTPPPCSDTGELVAVHAGRLLTPENLAESMCFDWMRLRQPDQKIGYSIFIYNAGNAATRDVQGYLNKSLALYNAGKFNESIEAGRKALQWEPNNAEAYNNICAAHNNLKHWRQAIDACNRAISLKPGHALAKNNLAWAKQNMARAQP